MHWGTDKDGKFYVEHSSCTRPAGTLKIESDRRARDIFLDNNKLTLCLSSGLDSQIALVSFLKQDIPIEIVFLRLDGFNENEYENLKTLEKKWGFKAEVINLNPNSHREEIEFLKSELDVHANHCIQHMFVRQLPKDRDIIQVLHDPWIMTDRVNGIHYVYQSYYDPEIGRYRALDAIKGRTGKIIMFGDSSEYFLSSINDDLFHNFLNSWVYYDNNGFEMYGKKIPDVLRYEYYIKPMLYAKHWGNDLKYFPKFSGYENIDWLYAEVRKIVKEKQCFIPWKELISHFKANTGAIKRYTEYNKADHS